MMFSPKLLPEVNNDSQKERPPKNLRKLKGKFTKNELIFIVDTISQSDWSGLNSKNSKEKILKKIESHTNFDRLWKIDLKDFQAKLNNFTNLQIFRLIEYLLNGWSKGSLLRDIVGMA